MAKDLVIVMILEILVMVLAMVIVRATAMAIVVKEIPGATAMAMVAKEIPGANQIQAQVQLPPHPPPRLPIQVAVEAPVWAPVVEMEAAAQRPAAVGQVHLLTLVGMGRVQLRLPVVLPLPLTLVGMGLVRLTEAAGATIPPLKVDLSRAVGTLCQQTVLQLIRQGRRRLPRKRMKFLIRLQAITLHFHRPHIHLSSLA